ncbi:MAG: YtxH domain-containing protein [Nitrospirae bacterium]|jgi:gas vesicle protein|nr:YtxH domain-containing protein [Nitrospirota bacterium]
MREEGGYGAGSIILSFLLGGVVGAGVALLLAPQSGRETRQKIMQMTEDVKEKAMDYVGDVKEKITGSIDKGKEFFDEKKSIISSAIEAGKEAYEREKERLSKEENA